MKDWKSNGRGMEVEKPRVVLCVLYRQFVVGFILLSIWGRQAHEKSGDDVSNSGAEHPNGLLDPKCK